MKQKPEVWYVRMRIKLQSFVSKKIKIPRQYFCNFMGNNLAADYHYTSLQSCMQKLGCREWKFLFLEKKINEDVALIRSCMLVP